MRKQQHSNSSKLLTVLLIVLVLPITIFMVQHLRSVQGAPSSISYIIYDDSLAPGWENRSWVSSINFDNTAPTYSGGRSIAFTPTQKWAGLSLYTDTAVDTTPYSFLHFAAQASQTRQYYAVMLYNGADNELSQVHLANYGGDPVPGTWKVYNIPLSDLSANATQIRDVAIQTLTSRLGTLYLDSISLTGSVSSPTPMPNLAPTPTPTLAPTAAPTLAPTLTSTAASTGRFTTLPPGSPLPSESECAARVRYSSFEPRPQNYTANHQVPTAAQIASLHPWDSSMGQDIKADSLRQQITGNFTGTTDEILQWVACKWGIDEDIVRAEAQAESTWHQSTTGDFSTSQGLCPPGTWNGSGCYQSYGILQIKYIYNASSWSMSRDDTAFSAEYMYGIIRACYEGWTTYLSQRTPLPGYPNYQAGDIWGCVGRWYGGGWYDQGAVNYIKKIQTDYANKDWLKQGF